MLEVGSGDPILFVHGTAGPGAWPALIRELDGFRCLILDRPGWGLSSAVDYSRHDYGALIGELLEGTLDRLGVDRGPRHRRVHRQQLGAPARRTPP